MRFELTMPLRAYRISSAAPSTKLSHPTMPSRGIVRQRRIRLRRKPRLCPREESNSHFFLRTELFCPLNYEGFLWYKYISNNLLRQLVYGPIVKRPD